MIALLTIGVLCSIVSAQNPQQNLPPDFGAIRGRVLNTEGHPVSGVQVNAAHAGPGPSDSLVLVTYTNRRGGFFFRRVIPAIYEVYAIKDEKDYRDISFLIDESGTATVTVYEGQVTRGVVVRLNMKRARLSARVVDAGTGQPIKNPTLFLCRNERFNYCPGTGTNQSNGQFRLLIPPITLRVKVTATDYEDWYYGNDGSKEQADVLHLAPGTTKELSISLRPIK